MEYGQSSSKFILQPQLVVPSCTEMDRGGSVGQGFVPSSTKGGDTRNTPATKISRSAIDRSLVFKSLFFYKSSILLMLGLAFLSTISASGNFNVQSTEYNCTTNMICLGQAHVYAGENTSGIQVGRLSLSSKKNPFRPHNAGLAYYHEPVRLLDPSANVSASFNTSFGIDIRQEFEAIHGDGLAFVISANNAILGKESQKLGIFDVGGTTAFKSIVVEFDGYQNLRSPENDISDNHVSFDFRTITAVAAANASLVNVSLWGNRTIYAWVEYSNETQQLELRVSHANSRPRRPLLNCTVNLFDFVEEYMWVGFSGGTGAFWSNYYIGDWTFESYGIRASSPGPSPAPTPRAGLSRKMLVLIVGISVGILALLFTCISTVIFLQRKANIPGRYRHCMILLAPNRVQLSLEAPITQIEGMPERFSYRELRAATRCFSKDSKLGQGGFGSVYRGVLLSGLPVAVKRIDSESTQCREKEFMAELCIISRLRHRNLIQLVGWCQDAWKGNYLLVYELMPNQSLDKALFEPAKRPCLSWQQRFNIVRDTAAALEYLHQGWTQQVIHRDIKSSNIMLDEKWNAKLGDFGLARLVEYGRTAATTVVAGTYGYIAPDVAVSGKYTDKSDVYAFGAVALEVACGRRAFLPYLPDDAMHLVDWVWQNLSKGDLMSTVDKRLEGYDPVWMEVMLKVGLLCSHPNPLARPAMRQVVHILAGDAPVPPVPVSKPIQLIVYTSGQQSTDGSVLEKAVERFQQEMRT